MDVNNIQDQAIEEQYDIPWKDFSSIYYLFHSLFTPDAIGLTRPDRQWLEENNITNYILTDAGISFTNKEDAILFKLARCGKS